MFSDLLEYRIPSVCLTSHMYNDNEREGHRSGFHRDLTLARNPGRGFTFYEKA